MTEDAITQLADFELPFKRAANLKNVAFEGGFEMLRLTLRENRRFTIVDLDPASADAVGQALVDWASSKSAPHSD